MKIDEALLGIWNNTQAKWARPVSWRGTAQGIGVVIDNGNLVFAILPSDWKTRPFILNRPEYLSEEWEIVDPRDVNAESPK